MIRLQQDNFPTRHTLRHSATPSISFQPHIGPYRQTLQTFRVQAHLGEDPCHTSRYNQSSLIIHSMAEDMFRPPVNRAMRVLDRSFFQKKIPASAARVVDNKTISKCRSDLFRSNDVLRLERYQIVRPDPNEADAKAGKKCILLRPQVDEKGEPY